MSITINQTSTSQLKRRAQLSLPVLRKIATLNNKIKKIEEEIRENELLLSVDNEWAYKVFNKSITKLILVNIVDGKTKLSYNPAFFNIEEVSYTDKNGRLIKKENVTWKGEDGNLLRHGEIDTNSNCSTSSVQIEESEEEKTKQDIEPSNYSEITTEPANGPTEYAVEYNDLETAFPEEI